MNATARAFIFGFTIMPIWIAVFLGWMWICVGFEQGLTDHSGDIAAGIAALVATLIWAGLIGWIGS